MKLGKCSKRKVLAWQCSTTKVELKRTIKVIHWCLYLPERKKNWLFTWHKLCHQRPSSIPFANIEMFHKSTLPRFLSKYIDASPNNKRLSTDCAHARSMTESLTFTCAIMTYAICSFFPVP